MIGSEGSVTDPNIVSNQLFKACILNGNAFKSIVDTMKLIGKEGNLVFMKDRIMYHESSADRSFTFQLVIWSYELPPYLPYYNYPEPYFVFGLEIDSLHAVTKQLQKADGLEIQLLHGNSFLFLRLLRGGKISNSVGFYQIMNRRIAKVYVDPETYIRQDHEPNCIVALQEFSDIVRQLIASEPSQVVITGYPRGIKFEAEKNGGFDKQMRNVGFCPDHSIGMIPLDAQFQIMRINGSQNGSQAYTPINAPLQITGPVTPSAAGEASNIHHPLYEVKLAVSGEAFAKLGKLGGNASKQSAVRIIAEAGKPLRVILHTGDFGYIIVLLRGRFI